MTVPPFRKPTHLALDERRQRVPSFLLYRAVARCRGRLIDRLVGRVEVQSKPIGDNMFSCAFGTGYRPTAEQNSAGSTWR